METFKLTMPNGILIEYTNSGAVATTAAVAVKVPKALELPKEAAPVKQTKSAPVTKAAKQPTKKATKAVKVAKPPKGNGVELLAQIRALKAAGKYSEAVQLTPASWLQVIGEIQLAAERNGTQYNAAVSTKKATKRVASKKRKAAAPKVLNDVAEAIAADLAPKEPAAAMNMKADTGSAKPTELAAPVEKAMNAKASLRDELKDIGVDGFANDLLCGDVNLKLHRELYLNATEDEVLDLMTACKQEAIEIEDAAERCEAANLSCVAVANGAVELWKFFAAKLNSQLDTMTAGV